MIQSRDPPSIRSRTGMILGRISSFPDMGGGCLATNVNTRHTTTIVLPSASRGKSVITLQRQVIGLLPPQGLITDYNGL